MSFYQRSFDSEHGGLAGAPKFPSSLPIRFLLRYARRAADDRALGMATVTLDAMARGGIYDQVGGGFHRYSTAATWLVPHFEKMLYDNALLAMAYIEGYQATGDNGLARVARQTLRYVSRDMTSPEGAFYSATDADSLTPKGEREEGWFFTWTPRELRSALGSDLARTAEAYYAVTESGNFEGRNILHSPRPPKAVTAELGLDVSALAQQVETIRDRLYEKRRERPAPLRDDKILSAWNGLMISAFARAALAFDDATYQKSAVAAANFLLARRHDGGRLYRNIESDQPQHDAYLDDYAFCIAGLLDLYEASHDLCWLESALELDRVLDQHYADPSGGYFLTSDDHESLLVRQKPSYDGAEPSGNSVQIQNLLRLYEYTTDEHFHERAEKALRAFGSQLSGAPTSLSEMLLAVDFYLDAPKEIVVVTPGSVEQAAPFLVELGKRFVPNRVLSVVTQGPMLEAQAALVPLLAGKVARSSKPTAYVCTRGVCDLPTTDPRVFGQQLGKVKRLAE
jgi:hypothetical protein